MSRDSLGRLQRSAALLRHAGQSPRGRRGHAVPTCQNNDKNESDFYLLSEEVVGVTRQSVVEAKGEAQMR